MNDRNIPGMSYQGGIRNEPAMEPVRTVHTSAPMKRPAPEPVANPALESEAGVPVPIWLTLGANSFFAQAGFPEFGCAFSHNKKIDLFFISDSILEEILTSIS